MVGLGGGFIAVPVLLLAFGMRPGEAAGTSLSLVVANSAAGATTYLLQRRVHIRLGLLFAAGGFPGSILGALAAARISAPIFDWLFAAFLIAVAGDMFVNRARRMTGRSLNPGAVPHGMRATRALALGFGVGVVSSLFGIGGGVLVVPSLLYFSDLPAHMISATSHFAILLTSPVGFATHWWQQDIRWAYVVPLVAGGILGGPIGARLSLRLNQNALLALVASALVIAALALLVRNFVQ